VLSEQISNCEIGAGGFFFIKLQSVRLAADVVNCDRVELVQKGLPRSGNDWRNDFPHKAAIPGLFDTAAIRFRYRAQDRRGRDPAALPRQLIAAARAADALQNVGVNQILKQTFKMPRRQIKPCGQSLRGNRRCPRMYGYVGYRGKSEVAAARK
jgi:hypothetical protein